MSNPEKRTVAEIGASEPGWDVFSKAYRRQGTTPEALREYAKYVGAVRKLSPKPLLKLSINELEDLDEKLLAKSKVLRTVLKMFFRGNKRLDMVDALPRQRRQKERRLGLEDILMPVDVAALIDHAGSVRDAAMIATLAATGARINELLRLRLKDVNPRGPRRAAVSWGAKNKEDTATLCIGIWGVPFTSQLNRYTHFQGLDGSAELGAPVLRDLSTLPALPVPPILSTQAHVADLQAKLEKLEGVARLLTEWEPDASRCAKCGIRIIRWTPTRKYCDACTLAMSVRTS